MDLKVNYKEYKVIDGKLKLTEGTYVEEGYFKTTPHYGDKIMYCGKEYDVAKVVIDNYAEIYLGMSELDEVIYQTLTALKFEIDSLKYTNIITHRDKINANLWKRIFKRW